jgi:Uncharacterized protein conserved in bacteria (DUF2330)
VRRRILVTLSALGVAVAAAMVVNPLVALACAGLIGSNGAVNLGRTTTLAAYHDGVEHYVTSFEFQGGGGEFGTLIPLPGVPTSVERGGAWTLQRLVRETSPPRAEAAFARDAALASTGAEVLLETRIDALDITVLKGGAPDVAAWATAHGFRLSPDAPEVLDFYAQRSPIFLAAVFDGQAAAGRGQRVGDGTPVHITIPTSNPWVPLRILGLGRQPADRVQADVFLLTDQQPEIFTSGLSGLGIAYDQKASKPLLNDLRTDEGMGWVPESMWLTKVSINSSTSDLQYDLAVDASGAGEPSPAAAGLLTPEVADAEDDQRVLLLAVAGAAIGLALLVYVARSRKVAA